MPLKRPLVLVGLPGCGKGTQGRLLSERIGIQHIDSGGSLRKLVDTEGTLKEIVSIIKRGYRFPGKVDKGLQREITYIILEANNWNREKVNLILDGFGRNSISTEILEEIFGDINFVNFITSNNLSRQRMEQRGEREGDMNYRFREGRIDAFYRKTLPEIQKMSAKKRCVRLKVEGLGIEEVYALTVSRLQYLGILY